MQSDQYGKNKMKVFLLQPPIQDFYETKIRLQPLGLAYLKAAIRRFLPETEVRIRDFHHGWKKRSVPLPQTLSYLHDYYLWPDKSPFALFHQYYHFGAGFDRIAEESEIEKPDLAGISVMFSPYYHEALQTAHAIKSRLKIPIVAGGAHVSASPESVLNDPAIDYVIRGEGERPIVDLIKTLMNGGDLCSVTNLGFKKEGQLVWNRMERNYDPDKLPWPDLSDLPPGSYRYRDQPLSCVLTSRGCPFRCAFCSVHQVFGREYRRRDNEDILGEIKFRYDQGYRVFDFEDDNLGYDLRHFKILCRELTGLFPDRDVTFLTMNGICYQNLDEESLTLMKKAGFSGLNISLVSADEQVVREAGRPHAIGKYRSVVDSAFRQGYAITAYQILGLPNESLESMVNTLLINSRLPVLIGVSPFYLSPGVDFSDYYNGYPENDLTASRLTALGMPTGNFDREDIYTLFITARIINFLKSFYFPENRIALGELLDRIDDPDNRKKIGIELLKLLLVERTLYAYTSEGLKPLKKFRTDLFFHFWDHLAFIQTQNGNIITTGEDA